MVHGSHDVFNVVAGAICVKGVGEHSPVFDMLLRFAKSIDNFDYD